MNNWTIRQPCSADWEKMRGDDKRRFCEHCNKFVHNISAMSKAERAVLDDPANIRECVFYSRRADGNVADLSFLARLRRWFPILRLACWSAFVAALPVTLSGCMGERSCCAPPAHRDTTPASSNATNRPASSAEAPR